MKYLCHLSFGFLLICLLPICSLAYGLRAPVINDFNAVIAKGDISTPVRYRSAIHAYLNDVQKQLVYLNQQLTQIMVATQNNQLLSAQQHYVLAHQSYERIRPIVILFGNVNQTINSRADDYLKGVQDPRFTGFHLLEYDLFVLKDNSKAHDDAVNLQYGIDDLHKRVAVENIDIAKMVQASADFMEMILNTKLSGQENQFSHSDLADIDGNVQGSATIIHFLSSFIPPAQLEPIQYGFSQIEEILQKYRLKSKQYLSFDNLTKTDHDKLYSLITEQADRLAKLRAVLNIDVYYKYRHKGYSE